MHQTLFERLFQEQKIAYIVTDALCNVLHYGGDINLLGNPDLSPTLLELIPELDGCEDLLQDILDGTLPNFQLENLNRISGSEITYINLVVLRYLSNEEDSQEPFLLIVLSDMSAWTRIQQTLTQQHNDLKLLQQKLDETNQRLDFILQRYVPREVAKALLENRIAPELGGEVREISILFADLRNYTSISEQLSPSETIELLNVCLEIATTAISEAGGVVVNYMGDAVMAVFNAPNAQPDHAYRAVQAGLTMQKLATLYQALEGDHSTHPPFYFGVGINTGDALVGNIGAQWHYQYTAIGDIVNVASRICGQAKPTEVLMGANTYAQVKHQVIAQPLAPMKFKGKSQEMVTYRVTKLIDHTLLNELANQ